MKIVPIAPEHRSRMLVDILLDLWNDSVRATHKFLSADSIKALVPCVEQALAGVPVLAVMKADTDIIGFVGIDGSKIEMLFVAPAYMGRGIGHRLVSWAVNTKGATLIDVNEQNGHAAAIYRHWGFSVYERSETDSQGNAFPVLRMRLGDGQKLREK